MQRRMKFLVPAIAATMAATSAGTIAAISASDGAGSGEEVTLTMGSWRSDDVEYNGTGLGLAIARGIVTAHGGRIWAESALGQGAKFLFTVPVADVTLLFTVPEPDAAPSANTSNDGRPTNGA